MECPLKVMLSTKCPKLSAYVSACEQLREGGGWGGRNGSTDVHVLEKTDIIESTNTAYPEPPTYDGTIDRYL